MNEFTEHSFDKRLLNIEENLKFMGDCYKNLHNVIVKGTHIQIDCTPFRNVCKDLKEEIKTMQSISEQIRNDSILGTLAFMAKQIHKIQEDVENLKEKGVKKNIHLDFTVDGYEMIKKKTENIVSEKQEPEEHIKLLLQTLLAREALVITHRYGLLGEESKTFEAIGTLIGTQRERARQIINRALRKLRDPSRKKLVKNITHFELKKDITGEK